MRLPTNFAIQFYKFYFSFGNRKPFTLQRNIYSIFYYITVILSIFCSILFYFVLFCSILFYFVLFCSILFYFVLFYSILFYFFILLFLCFNIIKYITKLIFLKYVINIKETPCNNNYYTDYIDFINKYMFLLLS
jgi:hypothetical protein